MVLTIGLDSITASIVLTGIMILLLIVIIGIAYIFRRISIGGEEMYIGGESEEILMYKIPSVLALYWGIVRRAWGKAFKQLRDAIHTGILNDWYSFMSIWLTFLLLLAFIVMMLAVR